MSRIVVGLTVAIHRHARTLSYPPNASRLNCCLSSSNANYMANDESKTQLSDDSRDELRESKRMKFSSDLSANPFGASTDAYRGPSGSVSTSIPNESSSATDTQDVKMKRASSIKRSSSVGYAKSGKGKQKDQKKSERRNRRGTRDEPTVEGEDANVPKAPRLPKRQCALLIGFCGSGYSGMQMYVCSDYTQLFLSSISSQPDHDRTIEGVLFQAMVRAGTVSQDNADDPVKVNECLPLARSFTFSYFVDQSCTRCSDRRRCPCSGQPSLPQNDYERPWGARHGGTYK